jgi:hypothetical protein
MKITFIGHAAILIETRELTILSDPWWGAPCFGAQWWNYPRADSSLVEGRKIDYIYVSHGHHDHMHPGTLNRLDKSARVLVSADADLAPSIRKLGFEVLEVETGKEVELGNGVRCRIYPTHGDDSLMVLDDGEQVCVNVNDALISTPTEVQDRFIKLLRTLYPKIDYVFCGYGVASHFPNCYRIPGKNREATAAARQRYFNGRWARLMTLLDPRFAMPFAADVVFLQNDLFWVNEPTHNSERPSARLEGSSPQWKGRTFDIAPGFAIEDGRVVNPVMRKPILAADLEKQMADEIVRANRFGVADLETVVGIQQLIEENIAKCREYLASFPADYRMLVRFPGAAPGIAIRKQGREVTASTVPDAAAVDADLIFTTRAQYLRTSLTREYGNETIFVGSGGIFDFKSRAAAETNMQRELAAMIRMNDVVPRPRPSPNTPLARCKRVLKRLLGYVENDLYDLGTWTVWTPAAGGVEGRRD